MMVSIIVQVRKARFYACFFFIDAQGMKRLRSDRFRQNLPL